jgi:hypothetical protein
MLFQPDSWLVAAVVTFAPFIPGWYGARAVHKWYVYASHFIAIVYWRATAAITFPGYAKMLVDAHEAVTPEYVERFTNDPTFRAQEMAKADNVSENLVMIQDAFENDKALKER